VSITACARLSAAIIVFAMAAAAMPAPSFAEDDIGPCDDPTNPPRYPDKFNWNGAYLLGDLNGLRNKARDIGVTLCSQYNAYAFDNAKGGLKRGDLAQGQLFSWIDVDLGTFSRLGFLDGTSLHAAAYAMHGRSITTHEVGSFAGVSAIENDSTGAGSVWLDRSLFGDKLSVRFGLLDAADEFLTSPTAGGFVNSTFAFPSWAEGDLVDPIRRRNGALREPPVPAFRLRYDPTDSVTLMAGVYANSSPLRQGATPSGGDGGSLWIGEAAYTTDEPDSNTLLKGTYKLGAWYRTGLPFDNLSSLGRPDFEEIDQRLRAARRANGLSPGTGDAWGIYGVVDQTILPGSEDGVHRLASFLRAGASPVRRSIVDLYLDGGLTFGGPIPARPNDLVGIGAGYSRIGADARAINRDARLLAASEAISDPATFVLPTSPFAPMRDQEVVLEAFYSVKVTQWLKVDLDVQHFFHPSGHVLAISGPDIGKVVKDATLFGASMSLKF
jgi:porin